MIVDNNLSSTPIHSSLLSVFRFEMRILVPLIIIVFFIASLLMSGWPEGLLPNTQYPYLYSSDALFTMQWIKRSIEGWVFNSDLSGFPFGSNNLDFPASDFGNLFLVKILGIIFGSMQAAHNLLFLLGFSAAFAASYVVFRALNISRPLSAAGSVLFTFLPYHFLRLEHLFLSNYFVVPIYLFYGYRIFSPAPPFLQIVSKWKIWVLDALCMVTLSCFGVYYAFFGALIFAVAGFAGFAYQKSSQNIKAGTIAILLVSCGVLINTLPNIIFSWENGTNSSVAYRSPAEAEIYGLKLVQMLLPRPEHRSGHLAYLTKSYDENFPLVTENAKSSLGIVGAVGLVIILVVIFTSLLGWRTDIRITFLACVTLTLFLFATVGGFSSLFSMLVSPMIRGWNRVSVFIGFTSIASTLIFFEIGLNKFALTSRNSTITAIIALAIACVGFWDQTTSPCRSCNELIKNEFISDRTFVKEIENIVSKDAAIYQLPYLPFPAVPPLFKLQAYDLLRGYLHSDTLHWSFAGMNGREGDSFYRSLAQQPIEQQIEVIRRLGFSGIYLDRRGFEDGGFKFEQELSRVLGTGPRLISKDSQLALYIVSPAVTKINPLESSLQIIKNADLFGDNHGLHYDSSIKNGLDFRKPGLPSFVKELSGVSVREPWGRWSDANMGNSISIELTESLPEYFTLVLRGQAFGPNIGRNAQVVVGEKSYSVAFQGNIVEKKIKIESNGHPTTIKIIPPTPTSPQSLGINGDARKLGIGLESMSIAP